MSNRSHAHEQSGGNIYFFSRMGMCGCESQIFTVPRLRFPEFRDALCGCECQIFTYNLLIKVPSVLLYRYADLSALCGRAEFKQIGGADAPVNPALIIEVLSP